MLRYLFAFIVFIHGAIHLMGFAKAFGFGRMDQLTKDISKPMGLAWLLAAILCVAAGALLLARQEGWWMMGLAAVIVSQVLIFTAWRDARFGTVANGMILVAGVLAYGSWRFESRFQTDVAAAVTKAQLVKEDIVTPADIGHLPVPVQKYLTYVGVLNRPKVSSYHIRFEGQMRERGKDWFPFTSRQYNFTREPTRLFFMQAQLYGMTVPGYHAYKNGEASMQVKLFGLLPVVSSKPGELDRAETVTIFNDMCLFAPASLIDARVQWEPVDALTAKATYTVNNIRISALLYFNERGQLVNFVSDDRYAIAEKKQFRFSTPVKDYQNFGGYYLPAYGEAVWHYPEGAFAYGRFHLKEVRYDVHHRTP
jgi:hypothetical protein